MQTPYGRIHRWNTTARTNARRFPILALDSAGSTNAKRFRLQDLEHGDWEEMQPDARSRVLEANACE